MNIMFICDEYPPSIHGGIGAATKVLAEELVQLGHTVAVAGFYPPYRPGKAYEFNNGVHIHRFFYGKSTLIPWSARRLIPAKYRYPSINREFLAYSSELKSLVSHYSIDLVEIPDYNEIFNTIPTAKVEYPDLGIPVVIKTHGSYTFLYGQRKQSVPEKIFEKEVTLYRQSSAVIAVSRFSALAVKSLFQLPESAPIETIYNGIRPPSHLTHPKNSNIVFAGSLVKTKGIYQLMKAWNIVKRKYPEATLDVCGKGSNSTIRKLKAMLTGSARQGINFRGHIDRNELLDLFERSTIAVFPSYFENFSMVPLEAMSRGCATIYTSRASGSEIITPGVDGLLVDPDREQEIANAIIGLIENDIIRKSIAANGIKTIKENFSMASIACRHIEFYQSVITRKKI